MANDERHGRTRHAHDSHPRSAIVPRYATHLTFLLVLAVTALGVTSQPLRALADRATQRTAVGVVASITESSKPGGTARVASLARIHADDNVVRRGIVPTEMSLSDPVAPDAAPGKAEAVPRGYLTYTVQAGDTLFDISSAFGLAPETVLWSNYRVLKDNPELLSIGLELVIPPSDGLITEAESGDTVDAIARRYKVTPEAIIAESLNGLASADQTLPVGKQLFVPGGTRELVIWEVPKPVEVQREKQDATTPASVRVYSVGTCGEVAIPSLGSGGFVYPTGRSAVSGYDFTSTHPGIDFAANMGDAIYAADSGTVIFAGDSVNAAGQYIGYGKYVVIDHGNGYQTLYSHNSQNYVTCGQQVLRGSVIAAVGSTGNSTGPHLHFEIRNNRLAVNPWGLLPPR